MQRDRNGGEDSGGKKDGGGESHDAEHTAEKEDADQNERCRESDGGDADLIHREAERKEVDETCYGEGDGEDGRKFARAREHTEGVVHYHHGDRVQKHQKSVGDAAAKHFADETAFDKAVVRFKRENDRGETCDEDFEEGKVFGVEGISDDIFDRTHNMCGEREKDTTDREEDHAKRLHKEKR